MSARIFEGLLVLDLSRVLAGPTCAQMMADFGAEVIKVEGLEGDEIRSWFPRDGEESTNFQSANRGKKSITLDLKQPEGREILDRLVARADVLIHSFLPPVAQRLGVTYERLHAVNPDLVHCSISGYGSAGPLSNHPGYDLMLQAFTGVMTLTGEPGGAPMRAGLSAIDLSTSMLGFGAISAALFARASGKCRGQEVRLSLLETGVALLGYHVTNLLNGGFTGLPSGSGVGHIVPYQAWNCEDGYLLAGAPNDNLWRRFCGAVGLPELADDARFASATTRRENRDVLVPMLEQRFRTASVAHWREQLDAVGVPASPVHTLAQVVQHEQVLANDMIVQAQDHRGKQVHMVGAPIKMSETPAVIGAAPPALGAHTREVLHELLGLSASDIEGLRARGVVGPRPSSPTGKEPT